MNGIAVRGLPVSVFLRKLIRIILYDIFYKSFPAKNIIIRWHFFWLYCRFVTRNSITPPSGVTWLPYMLRNQNWCMSAKSVAENLVLPSNWNCTRNLIWIMKRENMCVERYVVYLLSYIFIYLATDCRIHFQIFNIYITYVFLVSWREKVCHEKSV